MVMCMQSKPLCGLYSLLPCGRIVYMLVYGGWTLCLLRKFVVALIDAYGRLLHSKA